MSSSSDSFPVRVGFELNNVREYFVFDSMSDFIEWQDDVMAIGEIYNHTKNGCSCEDSYYCLFIKLHQIRLKAFEFLSRWSDQKLHTKLKDIIVEVEDWLLVPYDHRIIQFPTAPSA